MVLLLLINKIINGLEYLYTKLFEYYKDITIYNIILNKK